MSRKRLDNVDGLRGLAAVSVLIGHWLELLLRNPTTPVDVRQLLQAADLTYFSPGRLGVVAFFCVSGFVIPFSFHGKHPRREFLISRFFRLYPAYWLSLLIAVIVFPLFGLAAPGIKQVLANVTMAQMALHQKDVLGVYWTLFIELIFYAICFGTFIAGWLHSPRFNLGAVVVMTGLALAGGLYRYLHPVSHMSIGVFTYLAAMHFGTLTRLAFLEGRPEGRPLWAFGLAILVAGTVAANTFGYIASSDKTTGWVASSTSYLAGLALFLVCIRFDRFKARWLVFLGSISFSLYLFHPIFLELAVAAVKASAFAPAAIVSAIFIFGGTLPVATLVYRWLERPSVRFGKAINRALDDRGAGSTPAVASGVGSLP